MFAHAVEDNIKKSHIFKLFETHLNHIITNQSTSSKPRASKALKNENIIGINEQDLKFIGTEDVESGMPCYRLFGKWNINVSLYYFNFYHEIF
jgi:hypothetical protein